VITMRSYWRWSNFKDNSSLNGSSRSHW